MRAFLASAGLCLLFAACERPSKVQVPMLPPSTTASPHDSGRGWIVVTVDKNAKRMIDDRPYDSNDSLREKFARVYSANPKAAVAINADRRAPFETVTTIMLLARTAGLTRVSLFVENSLEPEPGTGIVETLDLVLK